MIPELMHSVTSLPMAIDTKPLDQLDENDLLVLIAEGLSERRVRDYKAALPGNSEGERKEFLYDVSSFANAAGGHLIYGMVEEGGIPIQLPGIAIANAEAEFSGSLRWPGRVLTRILGLDWTHVPLASGNIATGLGPCAWTPVDNPLPCRLLTGSWA